MSNETMKLTREQVEDFRGILTSWWRGTPNEPHANALCDMALRAEELEREQCRDRGALARILAACMRDPLFAQFWRQEFWHAHHVDIEWRYNGEDRRHEADWLKDVWYALRDARAALPEPHASKETR